MLAVYRALGHPLPSEMTPIVEAREQPPVEAPPEVEPIDEAETQPSTEPE